MQKITPFLWFDANAEEALDLYTSIFPDSKITNVSRYGEGGPGPEGSVITANFKLFGQQFMALNGGPQYKFNEAISLFVSCRDQDEVDGYWNKLIADGGEEGRCGWLKDRFGLSWQLVPEALGRLLGDPDPKKSQRVMMAMLKMKKIIVADLEAAYSSK